MRVKISDSTRVMGGRRYWVYGFLGFFEGPLEGTRVSTTIEKSWRPYHDASPDERRPAFYGQERTEKTTIYGDIVEDGIIVSDDDAKLLGITSEEAEEVEARAKVIARAKELGYKNSVLSADSILIRGDYTPGTGKSFSDLGYYTPDERFKSASDAWVFLESGV